MADRRFQKWPARTRPIQGFTLPRNQETPIFHRLQITYMFRNKSTSHTHEYGPAAVLWWRGEECTRRRQRVLIISCDPQDGGTIRFLLTTMVPRKVAARYPHSYS